MSFNFEEEVIFKGFDVSWDREMPCLLITYFAEDGTVQGWDLHRQTGSQYEEHTAKALEILKERNLVLKEDSQAMVGPSGRYMGLKRV